FPSLVTFTSHHSVSVFQTMHVDSTDFIQIQNDSLLPSSASSSVCCTAVVILPSDSAVIVVIVVVDIDLVIGDVQKRCIQPLLVRIHSSDYRVRGELTLDVVHLNQILVASLVYVLALLLKGVLLEYREVLVPVECLRLPLQLAHSLQSQPIEL